MADPGGLLSRRKLVERQYQPEVERAKSALVERARHRDVYPMPEAVISPAWSFQARCRSSEPQVVTAQLIDRPANHQLHVAFDFGMEILQLG